MASGGFNDACGPNDGKDVILQRKIARHSGRDCRNPVAMEGNKPDLQVFNPSNFQP